MLCGDLPLQEADSLVFLLMGVQEFPLVVLKELYFFEENSKHALILVVLDLFLVIFDPLLVLLESPFDFEHVLFVRIDELCFLSL